MTDPKTPTTTDEFDDNPEWTEEDFAKARKGLPKAWTLGDGIRRTAAELRHKADELDELAAGLDKRDSKTAAE